LCLHAGYARLQSVGMPEFTRLLDAAAAGDPRVAAELIPVVYAELRALAAARLAAEAPGHTLQPTALVHEAYLRLVGGGPTDQWNGRAHFFGAAAEAMRRILIERVRRRQAVKHGGGRVRVSLDEAITVGAEVPPEVLEVDEAIGQLMVADPRAAELVKLRFFAGLTGDEAAAALGISPRAADLLWAYARAWLFDKLNPQAP
jgi:RNA polymerase sigma factor (TIGR02999 family)